MRRIARGVVVWCSLSWLALLAVPDAAAQRLAAPKLPSPPVLTLAVIDSASAVGRFDHQGGTIIFESHRYDDGGRLELRTGDLQELLTIEEDAEFIRTSVLGGRATQIMSKSILREAARQARLPEHERTAFPVRHAIVEQGDVSAFDELTYSKDGIAIVALSNALGERGMHGGAYPSTTALHTLAMRIGTANGVQPPPPPVTSLDACQDLRSNPGNNDCLGMCGSGCDCWSSVCGDCCCHDGCLSHDRTCRSCSFWRPFSCLLCYSLASFFSGGGCGASCQETQWGEGAVQPHYEVCGINGPWADYDCAGKHEGSTEAGGAPIQWECQFSEPVYQCAVLEQDLCDMQWTHDLWRCMPR